MSLFDKFPAVRRHLSLWCTRNLPANITKTMFSIIETEEKMERKCKQAAMYVQVISKFLNVSKEQSKL